MQHSRYLVEMRHESKKNRRKRFLVHKPIQLHYLFYFVAVLVVVSTAGITGTYFGIWASVLNAFSEEALHDTMLTAAQIHEYEQARRPAMNEPRALTVRTFRETALLSTRQKEILQEILDGTHRRLIGLGIVLLVLIGWGSIFLTHKVAGPLFRLKSSFEAAKSGDLTLRIKLRKFDEAKDVAHCFNEMMAALDGKISILKQAAHQSPSASNALEKIRHELSKFKTTS